MLAITVVPLLVMLATALTPPQQLYARGNGLLPTAPTLLNFKRVLGGLSGAVAEPKGQRERVMRLD